MTKISLALIIASFAFLGWYGMKADLPYSRVPSEIEQIKFAVKFGTGDLNPKHFLHPPFFAYILFVLYGLAFVAGKISGAFSSVADFQRLYFTDPSIFYIIARYAALIFASSGIAIFYSAAKKLFDKQAALLASFLVASSPMYVKLAHYAAPDMPMFFLAMACLYFTVKIFKNGSSKDYVLAGLFLGLAMATKYGAVYLIMPILAAHILSPTTGGIMGKLFDRKLMTLGSCAILGAFLGNPFAFLDFKRFFVSFSEQGRRMSAFDYNFSSWKTNKPGWVYIVTDTMPFGLGGVSPVLLVIIGICYSFSRRRKEDYLLLALILTSYALIGKWSVIKPRYFIYVFPFALLLGTRFLTESVERIKLSQQGRICAFCILAALFAFEPLSSVIGFDWAVAKKPAYVQAREWIESGIPPNSGVAAFVGVGSVPLIPNEVAIDRNIKEIEKKRLGQGVMLRTMRRHLKYLPAAYDLHELSYPWREDYEDGDFDFKRQLKDGVRYFVFTQEAEEYYAKPDRYGLQVAYMEEVKKNCLLVRQFRQAWPKIEPGYISDDEYVQIYRYK